MADELCCRDSFDEQVSSNLEYLCVDGRHIRSLLLSKHQAQCYSLPLELTTQKVTKTNF